MKMSGLVEEIVDIDLCHIVTSLECLSSRDSQEMMLQWNLDKRYSLMFMLYSFIHYHYHYHYHYYYYCIM